MDGFPDSPEAVALALMDRILEHDESARSRRHNQTTADAMLELFSQCLEAANGKRASSAGAMLH